MGIIMSAEQFKALAEWAEQARLEAERARWEADMVRAGMVPYFIHQASREPTQPGKVVDIRELIKKRYGID